jgi:tellurite resistance protein
MASAAEAPQMLTAPPVNGRCATPRPASLDENHPPAKWIQPEEAIEIGGIRIISGMIYVGGFLPTEKHGATENCLIDPNLRVAPRGSDRSGQSMPYWPSYSEIQPPARRAYLEWLAGGRRDPDIGIGIGYVFLFFYGLERRFFIDGANTETQAITSEVCRLLTIYGANRSFHGYANRFLDAINFLEASSDGRPPISPNLRDGYEMAMSARLYLGRRLAEKLPFDPEDTLLWLLSVPNTYLRTPATRCFDEFEILWKIRFAERHPSGLKVKSPKTLLKLTYRAASSTFERNIEVTVGGAAVPDIAVVSAPLDGLKDLANACTEELEPYSRLLGRKPDARGTLEAAFLLPKALLETAHGAPVRAVSDQLDALLDDRSTASVMVSRLLEIVGVPLPAGSKLSAATSNQVGAFLDKIDIAFEPDRRYGSSSMAQGDRAILFKSPGGAPVDPDKASYKATKTLIEVAALAASADGTVAAEEYEVIKAELRDAPHLTMTERMRLQAYAEMLLRDAPRHQAVMNKLAKLSERDRRQVARSAIGVVLTDGHASPGEVKFLEKLYKTLGFPVGDVYAALHRSAVVIDEPVVVAPEQPASGIPIRPKPADDPGVKIDTARLQRIQQETSAVSALLAAIFVEEDTPPPPTPSAATSGRAAFPGLDAAHGELLSVVLSARAIDRAAFEGRARSLRVLPDGAFETINEWGFETFDEPILEGDDPIAVADHLRAELERLETAT